MEIIEIIKLSNLENDRITNNAVCVYALYLTRSCMFNARKSNGIFRLYAQRIQTLFDYLFFVFSFCFFVCLCLKNSNENDQIATMEKVFFDSFALRVRALLELLKS